MTAPPGAPRAPVRHKHVRDFLREIAYGGNDGIVTTFTVVAGIAGAAIETVPIGGTCAASADAVGTVLIG